MRAALFLLLGLPTFTSGQDNTTFVPTFEDAGFPGVVNDTEVAVLTATADNSTTDNFTADNSTADNSTAEPVITGGWSYVNVTEENTQVLVDALCTGNYSTSVGDTRVCFAEVTAVEEQVVAGWNYHFYINGCAVTESEGACSSETLKTCTLEEIVVDVFEQSWTNTLEVTGIAVVSEDIYTASNETVPGGWTAEKVTEDNTKILSDALTSGKYSNTVGDTCMCYTEVTGVETQKASGVNYLFYTTGCDVTGSDSEGTCSSETLKTCKLTEYAVQVFYESWSETLEITSIYLVKSGDSASETTPSTTSTETSSNVAQTENTDTESTSQTNSVTETTGTTASQTNSYAQTANEETQTHDAC